MLAADHGIYDREAKLNRKVRIQVWDTAGQERFRNITRNYYQKADGLLLVYDCTNPDTLDNITNWVTQIEQNVDKKVPKILLANKHDLPQRAVDHEKGKNIAEYHEMAFFPTSAKTGFNVNEAFEEIVRKVIELRDLEDLAQIEKIETEKSRIDTDTQGREALRVYTEENEYVNSQHMALEGRLFG